MIIRDARLNRSERVIQRQKQSDCFKRKNLSCPLWLKVQSNAMANNYPPDENQFIVQRKKNIELAKSDCVKKTNTFHCVVHYFVMFYLERFSCEASYAVLSCMLLLLTGAIRLKRHISYAPFCFCMPMKSKVCRNDFIRQKICADNSSICWEPVFFGLAPIFVR